jgi:hypothetical protein
VLKTGMGADDANGMRNSRAPVPAPGVPNARPDARTVARVEESPKGPGSRARAPFGPGALGYRAFRAVDAADDLVASRAMRVAALRNAVRSGRYAPSSEGVAEALLVWCVEPFPGPKALARAQ